VVRAWSLERARMSTAVVDPGAAEPDLSRTSRPARRGSRPPRE
jgi:hypothetical protein